MFIMYEGLGRDLNDKDSAQLAILTNLYFRPRYTALVKLIDGRVIATPYSKSAI